MEAFLQQIGFQTILMIAVIFMLMLMLSSLIAELRRKRGKTEHVVKELLECVHCRYSVEGEYEPGDFVSMFKGKCPQCGRGVLKIKAIYSVEKTVHENI